MLEGWTFGQDYYVSDELTMNTENGNFLEGAKVLTYENGDRRFEGKWVVDLRWLNSSGCMSYGDPVVSCVNAMKFGSVTNIQGDHVYCRVLGIAGRVLIQDEIWGNETLEYTKVLDKYTDGEIVNNIKYTYKGLG